MSTPQQAAPCGAEQLCVPASLAENFRAVCRDAWKQGLLSGCNGNASQPAAAQCDGNRARAGIQRILNEFLERAGRSFNHFASRDPIDEVLRQAAY